MAALSALSKCKWVFKSAFLFKQLVLSSLSWKFNCPLVECIDEEWSWVLVNGPFYVVVLCFHKCRKIWSHLPIRVAGKTIATLEEKINLFLFWNIMSEQGMANFTLGELSKVKYWRDVEKTQILGGRCLDQSIKKNSIFYGFEGRGVLPHLILS